MEVSWTAGNCGADGKQRSTHHQETIMNRARRPRTIRRINSTLLTMTALAAALVADCDVAQPATALPQPPADGGGTALPSTRPVVIGGMPGWQIALIALGAAATAVIFDRALPSRRPPVPSP
jgi:hypothetical protein